MPYWYKVLYIADKLQNAEQHVRSKNIMDRLHKCIYDIPAQPVFDRLTRFLSSFFICWANSSDFCLIPNISIHAINVNNLNFKFHPVCLALSLIMNVSCKGCIKSSFRFCKVHTHKCLNVKNVEDWSILGGNDADLKTFSVGQYSTQFLE